jgi:GNAT superfamily N-acetyltransferase
VTSDYATCALLADVFVLSAHRGRGLGKWLVETVMAHPELAGCGDGSWRRPTHTNCIGASGSA